MRQEFRRAKNSDVPRIMEIIGQAQAYFKEHGINQWQNGYPSAETIRRDILNHNGYVLVKDGLIVATVTVSFGGEETYSKIYDGKWMTDQAYAVIHRLAVDNHYKGNGLASAVLADIEKMCLGRRVRSIRVDTHRDNKSMQRMLEKNCFAYCGIIFLADGSKRMAFEKTLD